MALQAQQIAPANRVRVVEARSELTGRIVSENDKVGLLIISPMTGDRKSTVNLGRHRRTCSVCRHERRQEIESAFIGWRSPAAIAEEYALTDRASVYRHAHALGLFEKRRRNIRAALERIIEKAGDVDVTASAVVAAVQAYAKINAAGEWIDRTETVSMNDLFEHMSNEEMEAYAQSGALPGWFKATVGSSTL